MVDFNHPLSGKEVSYEVTIEKVVTDEKDIIEGYLKNLANLKQVDVEVKEGKAVVKLDIPEPLRKDLENKIKKRAPKLKSVKFIVEKPKK